MLSPYRLYKTDKLLQRTPRTFGPKGQPVKGSSGTVCYNHYNVDWTIHRLAPTITGRNQESRRTKLIGQMAANKVGRFADNYEFLKINPTEEMQRTSPRWGEGIVPGLEPRKVVPLPHQEAYPADVQISKKTQAAVGLGIGGAVGYKNKQKLQGAFSKGIVNSHPKYKRKITTGNKTRYIY